MHPEDQNISEIGKRANWLDIISGTNADSTFVAQKKDYDLADSLFKMLGKGPSREEFKAIGEIIYGLLDEGPVPGISTIQDSEEMLSVYLETAGTMELTPDDYEVIDEILGYVEEEYSDKCPIALECKRLLMNSSIDDN